MDKAEKDCILGFRHLFSLSIFFLCYLKLSNRLPGLIRLKIYKSKYDNYLLSFHFKIPDIIVSCRRLAFLFLYLHLVLIYSDLWHSWSPEEQMEYEECDKNSMFGKLGCVAEPLS